MKNVRPNFDPEIRAIAEYVTQFRIDSELAYEIAYYDLLDSLACAFLALDFPACTNLLGPIVPGATLENGARIPGTAFKLEPVQAAFNLGVMIRWLDFNDTWLAAEWGHPSDNLAGILTAADYCGQQNYPNKQLRMQDIFTAMIKAHEIQGIIALENSFNNVGLDHVVLVKVATTALVTHLLGGSEEIICNALSLAWIDGQSLRTYRHAPNTGSRKSWAAGDASSRGVRLALLALTGEMGYPSALSAKEWGFYDASLRGKPLKLSRPFGSYVMENILFKASFPAEFHAQTAVEAAIKLFPQVKDRWEQIEKIEVETQNAGMRIINKIGKLYNPADRDHCLQYMIAIGLLKGNLIAEDYEDENAADQRIDALREKMLVSENKQFSKDYLDAEKRSIGNSLQIFFKDGSATEKVSVEYPIGHPRRRDEGIPAVIEKFEHSVRQHFSTQQAEKIIAICQDQEKITNMSITDFVSLFYKNE